MQIAPGDTGAAVLSVIEDGALIASAKGSSDRTGAYNGLDCGVPVRAALLEGEYYGVPGRCTVTIIVQDNGLDHVSQISAGCVHLNFYADKLSIGFFEDKILTTVKTFAYAKPVPMHQRFEVGAALFSDTLFVLLPDGTVERFVDPRVARLAGRFVQVETYWVNGDGAFSKIHAVRIGV